IRKAQTGGDYEAFRTQLNAEMHKQGMLPDVEIVDVQDGKLRLRNISQNSIALVDETANIAQVVPSAEKRAAAETPQDVTPRTTTDAQTGASKTVSDVTPADTKPASDVKPADVKP